MARMERLGLSSAQKAEFCIIAINLAENPLS